MCHTVDTEKVSLSARRAWIEMLSVLLCLLSLVVALRKESVDRNTSDPPAIGKNSKVALRKESVDRNSLRLPIWAATVRSLSARRAWIEMGKG